MTDTPDIVGFRTDNREMQTRFHFHADRCMGCHACEVACAEQNGLPPETQWRRVGEVETGFFPDTKRFFISSGCNHCLDAPCMKGCPTDAYQVNERGIVIHVDDACIGCQYCTWNCPYGVPTYQPDRRIVTKCDLCTNRLDEGRDPACVQACPAKAIEVETVPLEEVIRNVEVDGVGPDMPDPAISMPSTKITLPADVNLERLQKVDRAFVTAEDPHTPLIWMTVLTQLGLGGVAAIVLSDFARTLGFVSSLPVSATAWLAPAMMTLVGISLLASTLHLGRPFYAYRAMKNWRTSWLSREVVGLSAFAGFGSVFAVLSLFGELGWIPPATDRMRTLLGLATIVSGAAGVYCSARLYRVPARPAWDTVSTTFDFYVVGCVLGPAAFNLAAWWSAYETGNSDGLDAIVQTAAWVGLFALLVKAGVQSNQLQRWSRSEVFELAASADLYVRRFRGLRAVSAGLAMAGVAMTLPVASGHLALTSPGFLLVTGLAALTLTAHCLIQRYLFFVTVVPRNIPGNFLVASHRSKRVA